MTENTFFFVVFGIFALETIFGRFLPWALERWREYMELRESLYEEEVE